MSEMLEMGADPIWNVLVRLLVTLVVLTIIVRFIYYKYSKNKRNVFSFFLMGIMIFLVCVLLQTVKIELGVALGLFAIFAILRFRSENLSLHEMTYFFTIIGVAVINSMASFYNPVRGTLLINSIIILAVFILETLYHNSPTKKAILTYDKLELLDEDRKAELYADISARTHKKVEKVNLKKIDITKDTAELEIFFAVDDPES